MSKIFGNDYRHQTIMNWIKKAGLNVLKERSKQEQMDVVEMDELYTYIKKKHEKHGFGRQSIEKECALLHLK